MTQVEFLQVVAAVTEQPLLTQWLIAPGNTIDFSLAKNYEPIYLNQLSFFPCAWRDNNTLVVAVEEPDNPIVFQALQRIWPHAHYCKVLATEGQIQSLIVEQELEVRLLSEGKLAPDLWQRALAMRQRTSFSLGRTLTDLGLLSPSDYLETLSYATGLPIFSRLIGTGFLQVDPQLLQRFEPQEMLQRLFCPITWLDPRTIMFLVQEPTDLVTEAIIYTQFPGVGISKVLGTESDVAQLIDSFHYREIDRKVLLQLENALTLDQKQEADSIRQRTGSTLSQVLTRLDFLEPTAYLESLSRLTGLPIFSRLIGTDFLQVDPQLLQHFDTEEMMKCLFFPLTRLDEDTLLVLVQDPHDQAVETAVYTCFPGSTIHKVLGTEADITKLLDNFHQKEFIHRAVHQLFARSPEESAARVFTLPQLVVGYLGFALLLWSLVFNWWFTLSFLVVTVNLFFVTSILFKLILSITGAASQKQPITSAEVAAVDDHSLPIYTILVPVYNEPDVIPILIQALKQLDYPHEKLDVLLLLEEKDLVTIEAAQAAKPPGYVRFIYIPDSQPKTKPKACNYGLAFARGEYLTIYDAEDIPDTDQLKKSIIAFRKGPKNLVCVQAALNYFNRDENFLTRMFCLEYSYWFDYLLPGLEALRLPIPLGGTSNHFRADRLRELGGWDPFNVTEDADLGIRASQRGYTVGVIDSTTYEEANCQTKNWIRQRSRWIKGYMQTWLVHNRHPLKSIRRLGLKNWAAYQFFIGGTILSFLTSPIMWLLFIYWVVTQAFWLESLFPGWALYISLFNLVIGNGMGIYLNMIAVFRRRYYQLLPYALLNPFYWQLHSIAAYMALWQLFSKPFHWEKTVHGLSKFAPHAKASAQPKVSAVA